MGNDINESKLVGGKRKNGHKLDCSCHICENMKNKAKRGGYEEDMEKEKEKMMGGSKKKNGHKANCQCPICKNMNNSKKRGGSKTSRRTKKRRGGEEGEQEKNETIEEEEEKGEEKGEEKEEKKGGRKKKRGNGHKSNCQCPICKNMRKKKGGNSNDEPDIENQKGDIEEAGIKATTESEPQTSSASESVASASDYDALDAAEKGEAGQNVVGGTRKRRRGGKKWSRKSRRTRK
jgi:hypothetical protein